MNTDLLMFAAMITLVLLCGLYIVRSLKGLHSRQKKAEAVVHNKMANIVHLHARSGKNRRGE